MRTMTAVALAFITGCGSTAPEQPTPDGMEATENYEQNPDTPAVVDLAATHDFGNGLTITMVDLHRDVDPDGFNATTGDEGALPYVAWSWELTNNTGEPVQLGGTTSSCHVGDPLEEAEQPHLGDSLNPPDMLADGQTASWDADCWLDDDQSALQYTLDLYEADDELLGSVTFAGEVP